MDGDLQRGPALPAGEATGARLALGAAIVGLALAAMLALGYAPGPSGAEAPGVADVGLIGGDLTL